MDSFLILQKKKAVNESRHILNCSLCRDQNSNQLHKFDSYVLVPEY